MTEEFKLLQLFYAGVLADSVNHFEKAGILDDEAEDSGLQRCRNQVRELDWRERLLKIGPERHAGDDGVIANEAIPKPSLWSRGSSLEGRRLRLST